MFQTHLRSLAILSFKDLDAEAFFLKGSRPKRRGWGNAHSIARRKLDMLHYARELKDLLSPPGNRLELLSGNLAGLYSIRINDQWPISDGIKVLMTCKVWTTIKR